MVGGSARPEDSQTRFHLAVQRSRGAVILLLAAVALAGRASGVVQWDLAGGLVALSLGLASVALFTFLYRRGIENFLGEPLHAWWMALDIGFTCWTIWLVRDQASLWLIWFLTNSTAAAFVAGRKAAVRVMIGSAVAYLALLVAMGEIRGLDRGLLLAVGRLVLLFGGTSFMVRGIADLREKRLEIASLVAEKTARVDELSHLTAELDRRGRELGEANLRIREADRAKSQFLANMSHELRTPLNSIIGFSEILGEKLDGRIEPRYLRFLANILASGRHLLGLINDILDLSKIEAGRMDLQLEPVSLADVVHGVDSVMHGIAAKREIRLRSEVAADLPLVVADPPRLKQILYNLVSNAVKFSADGQEVRILARPVGAADSPLAVDSVEILVVDHGIGIRREDQSLVFEEFRQVDGGTTRALGGTGLGLALVRRFVELHHGEVTLDSEPGQGSTFRVILPIDARPAAPEPAAVPAAARASAAGRPTVLVVEDDDEFHRALAVDLEAAGYAIRRARSGEAALAIVRSDPPDVITLDLVLPGQDGWSVLKELKADPATARIPVIIVSLIANHELGFALGAEDYFVKPLDRGAFLARLRELLPAAAVRRATVLVIDDDPQIHDLLAEELGEAGYTVLRAVDGRSGVEQAIASSPAVIVLDLAMPEMDGFAAAEELQARRETATIPILVLTARELSATDRARLAGRTAALLSKAPTDRLRVVATVRELETRRRLRAGAETV
jgi:signal transduction histidine kinase/DNA-binding response OmpR family regulator